MNISMHMCNIIYIIIYMYIFFCMLYTHLNYNSNNLTA